MPLGFKIRDKFNKLVGLLPAIQYDPGKGEAAGKIDSGNELHTFGRFAPTLSIKIEFNPVLGTWV